MLSAAIRIALILLCFAAAGEIEFREIMGEHYGINSRNAEAFQ